MSFPLVVCNSRNRNYLGIVSSKFSENSLMWYLRATIDLFSHYGSKDGQSAQLNNNLHVVASAKELGYLSRYSDGPRAGRPGFGSRQGQEIFLFSTVSRPALRPTQPPIQWVPWAFPPWVKQPGRNLHLLPRSRNSNSTPHAPSWCGA
jgi:hypothetical protein